MKIDLSRLTDQAVGQKTAANSLPVVLASDQVVTLDQAGLLTEADFDTKGGSLTETAPATDTASSGLNGRLQRIAQRITSLIALIPAALGQGTMAQSLKVVLPSDQSAIPVNLTTTLASATLVVPTQIIKTVAASATPEALAADGTFFQTATLIGKKAARTLNAGTVYLGIGSTNDTQALEILPGEIVEITASSGQKYDLNDWYLDVATAGDGVVVIYS